MVAPPFALPETIAMWAPYPERRRGGPAQARIVSDKFHLVRTAAGAATVAAAEPLRPKKRRELERAPARMELRIVSSGVSVLTGCEDREGRGAVAAQG